MRDPYIGFDQVTYTNGDDSISRLDAREAHFGQRGADVLEFGTAAPTEVALGLGGRGGDLYVTGFGDIAVVYDGFGSPGDELFLNGMNFNETVVTEIDGRHLFAEDLQTQTRALVLDWRDEDHRIETFSFDSGEVFSFSEAAALLATNRPGVLGNISLEAAITESRFPIPFTADTIRRTVDYYDDATSAASSDDYAADSTTTGQLSLGDSVSAELETTGDRDWFELELEAGEPVQIDLQGEPSGLGTLQDPRLRIWDPSARALVTEDDDGGEGFESSTVFTPGETGTYYVSAGAFTDGGTGTYVVSASPENDDPGSDDGSSPGPDPLPDSDLSEPAARVFLNSDATFTLADPAVVFGRSGGDESVELTPGARGVRLDGNIETVTLPQALSSTTLQVRDGRLEVRGDSEPLITFTSGLNAAVTLQFTDGEGTLTQTGAARFTLAGPGDEASIGDSPVTPEIGFGGAVRLDGSDDGRIFDAASGDTTLDFADGDYDVTVNGFSEGDVLDFADVGGFNEAVLNIQTDSNQSDGQQILSAVDPVDGREVTVTLTGLTAEQDGGAFNTSSFEDVFGSEALVF